ncbi:hypothetical protein B7494_g2879 [Chlorociboria aeruginascens]|nr:hypothetical protein B7494_g2879 [Chlorociboria aeruginascens]
MRGALVGLIYNHTLQSPDGLYDESAAVTLMSTDIDRIALSMQNLHEIWARTIELAISIWLLEKELGAVCTVPIILVITCLGCFERIQKYILGPRRKDQRFIIGSSRSPALSSRSSEEAGIQLQTLGLTPTSSQNYAISDLHSQGRSTISELNRVGILVRDLTARPTPKSEPVIVDLNLQLERSSITMITGPVGSGKSTLFRALLGELTPDKGSVSISSSEMAYCAQTPWLPNQTIQKCICGLRERPDSKYNWYQSVLHACCLDEDLLQFPQSDQTILGNRGLTLSGGQKQRVALARAIYARQEILLLDDVLSALDTKTQQLIVDRLLGQQGLLRNSKTTVVLITNTTRYLHLADHIVVLSQQGTITEQGTFNSLREEEGYLENLIFSPAPGPSAEITTIKNTSKALAKIQGPSSDQVSDLTRKTGDISVYLYYYKSMSFFSIMAFLASSAVAVFCRYFPQVWLEWWTEANGAHIAKYLTVYVILSILAMAFRASTLWWSFIWIAPRSSIALHYALLKTAMNAPHSYYTKTDIGTTLNRQDMGLIDRNLPLASTVTIFRSTYMACTLPLAIGSVYVLQKFYLLTSRQLRYLDLEARSPLYTQFIETLEGLSTIRATGWQTSCLEMNTQCLDIGQRPFYLLFCIQRWLNLVLDLMVTILATVVVALAVKIPSSTTGAAIGIALNNVLGFTQSLSLLVDNFTQLETSLGAISRLKNFEREVISENLPGEIETPPENWPENGLIVFQEVTAAYESSASPVLRNISMTVYPGQKIGICGRTGSGKSSLLLTLLRILEIQSGSILIDGVDLSTIPREKVRTSMTTIPQDPFIFNDTVRINADPTGVASDDKIISALSKVKLWDTIESRGGLDAQMKVQPLSHGQQQLFVLARAILCKDIIKILILDEATSQVDLETDQLMQDIIRREFKTHVIITVAHRLNTILDSDRVAVLSHGELVEFGDPRELMGKPSWFRDMHG